MLASVNSNKTLPCLVLIEYGLACGSREKVLSDQLIKGCCIDRLSWHDLSGLVSPEVHANAKYDCVE